MPVFGTRSPNVHPQRASRMIPRPTFGLKSNPMPPMRGSSLAGIRGKRAKRLQSFDTSMPMNTNVARGGIQQTGMPLTLIPASRSVDTGT